MTTNAAVYRRVLRRETRAARTWPAVIVAALLAVTIAAVLVGGIWSVVDTRVQGQISAAAEGLVSGIEVTAALVIAGIVLLVTAGILIALAVTPGRRGLRARMDGRVAVLVDDGVLADAAADGVASRCGTSPSQVAVTVRRRELRVQIVPTTGIPVNRNDGEAAAREAAAGAGFTLAATVRIADRGVVS